MMKVDELSPGGQQALKPAQAASSGQGMGAGALGLGEGLPEGRSRGAEMPLLPPPAFDI